MVTYCSRSDCKVGALSQKQAETTMKLLGNPFCPEHASEESAKSAEAGMSPRDKVIAYLHRENFKDAEKDFFKLEDGSGIAVDLRGFGHIVGVIINGKLEEEGHGVTRVMDIRNQIETILKSKGAIKKEQPAPKPAEVVKPKGEVKKIEEHKEKGLVPQEKSRAEIAIVRPLTQNQIIEAAASTSKLLVDVIEKANLYSMIQQKKYVRVEGWETLGALLLCSSEIVKSEEYKNGYRAEAIIKNQDGKVISNGIGICLRSEKNWANRDDFAICSMAQTRAIGKAYRLGFAWIMSLAGYEVCPVEEMDETKA